jgi:hypothetical protein
LSFLTVFVLQVVDSKAYSQKENGSEFLISLENSNKLI